MLGPYRHLLCDYYVLTALVVATYAPLRMRYESVGVRQHGLAFQAIRDFGSWERHVAATMLLSAIWRWKKSRSVDRGVAYLTLLAQLSVLIVAYVCDVYVFLTYLLAFAVIFLLFPVPMHDWSTHIEDLSPVTFKEQVADPATAGASDVAWVVVFYSDSHRGCRQMASMFAGLAAHYRSDKVRFAKLDVGEWPDTAVQLDLDGSNASVGLPAVALYEKGEEKARLPRRTAGGKAMPSEFQRADVVRAFELDMRLARSLQGAAAAATATAAAADKKDK